MYKLEKLPYKYYSLEPYIDTHTLALHHQKYQKIYLKKLNELLAKNNYNYQYPLEELPKYIQNFNIKSQEEILFNLGGVINHNLYFNSISQKKEPPNIFLKVKIMNKYGDYEIFKEEFKKKALSLKGSGYTFLVLKDNDLDIINLENQETPYTYNYIPLICLDMWEHAYYINYENKKELYIDNFFEIIDFKKANSYFEQC